MDAGFLNVVKIGQYFMTKDTADLSQFNRVALSWIHLSERTFNITSERMDPREHQYWDRIGSCNLLLARWERSWDQNCLWTDNSHSWVRTSHGSNKFVMNANKKQEIPEVQLEENAFWIGCERFCMPIKGWSKTTKKRHQEKFLLWRERGLMLNQVNIYSPIMTYRRNWFCLRHGKQVTSRQLWSGSFLENER